jgi:hypothetical protein
MTAAQARGTDLGAESLFMMMIFNLEGLWLRGEAEISWRFCFAFLIKGVVL